MVWKDRLTQGRRVPGLCAPDAQCVHGLRETHRCRRSPANAYTRARLRRRPRTGRRSSCRQTGVVAKKLAPRVDAFGGRGIAHHQLVADRAAHGDSIAKMFRRGAGFRRQRPACSKSPRMSSDVASRARRRQRRTGSSIARPRVPRATAPSPSNWSSGRTARPSHMPMAASANSFGSPASRASVAARYSVFCALVRASLISSLPRISRKDTARRERTAWSGRRRISWSPRATCALASA